MPAIQSQVDPQSESFRRERAQMLALIDSFRTLEDRVRNTSNSQEAKFRARKQLLPRERIALLLDRGSSWLEFSTLAGFRMHDDDGEKNVLGGGIICGIGVVSGIRCMVIASDSAIKGGTITPMGMKKSLRAEAIALENKLPVVRLVESGGANLMHVGEVFIEGGRGFANQARLSARGIPQVCVMHGHSTAGGAYLPGMSDYVIMVRGRAKAFLAGPPLLKAATGEIATDEELGGAEMHCSMSGVAEYLAEDDADGIRIARDILARLPWNDRLPMRAVKTWKEPRYPVEQLAGVVPTDFRQPYDMREMLARLIDDSDFLEFKPLYGSSTVCGHGAIEGHPCGFIGNNGPIDPQGATKATQFIQLCCQSGTPIVYLQNTTGFMVGKDVEQVGMIKHGAKMIQAVANATVPQITVMTGASFGAGNYGMCGRAYDPRFVFSWPNARVAVMGGEQAATVMRIVTEEKFARTGKEPPAETMATMKSEILARFDLESHSLFATARLWDDGIIDPRDTRRALATTLAVCREAALRPLNPNTFGVARM
ncbi:acyl-CoA carboxylase subunit beta [Hydrogenophaga aromaticivorans]|mgnify:FL=1|jgi:geranyl-CoA carboxylase beta subunit|uniref:Acyl-CoA carboxylase subunit beta n=1 Tax=Hydrogenophaga aromaticivorans TaxID=2610898 RepID=A0A7Y8GVV3_9BURK|nr:MULTISPECIES: carboxyl transferase domain-containing protein [Hydrogenophaga]MBU4181007.1 acyl-CoA carboxylase subunit beta [Gammaproteobacteria bacterium]MDI3509250.1 geranyl-CoA carboxylase beta subunit [Betaproteobacteria bacterium]MBQ0921517.1 acyl-CoA carboxylase subunit beta [Hydrogenophaga aromaticivorans]MBU4282487.1 acyl-CoA carboxylase subunit beta [Gammaproteobacteria bacterium]MBU4322068.1 acyl-CoA carboxylase subunit beta [Gammaproteobacteria bacterium]